MIRESPAPEPASERQAVDILRPAPSPRPCAATGARVWGQLVSTRKELRCSGARLWHRGGSTERTCDVVVTGPKRGVGCYWPARATVVLPDGQTVEVPGTLNTFHHHPSGDHGYAFCPIPGHPALQGVDL